MSIENFQKEIVLMEAGGLLSDLMSVPELSLMSLLSSENGIKKAKEYVASVIDECLSAGHAKIHVYQSPEHGLVGWAVVFIVPNSDFSAYLHKVFIKEDFRGQGAGKVLIQSVLDNYGAIGLLCQSNLVPMYEKLGFKQKGWGIPVDNPKMQKSRFVYSGLSAMTYKTEINKVPVFMLNDRDISKISSLLIS